MNDKPLIYTTRGNVPIDSLRYEPQWVISNGEIVFKEMYFAKDTGELVKAASHVLALKGMARLHVQQGDFGNG